MPDALQPLWRRYLRFWRPNVAADVDDEFAFHVEECIDELVAGGMDPLTARQTAMRRLRELEQVKATCRVLATEKERSMRRMEWFSALQQDVTYALRNMRAHPSLTAAIVVTIALGIGATTSLFSVVNAVLLRPLPYADADRLVTLRESIGGGTGSVGTGVFTTWAEEARSFESVSLVTGQTYNLTDGAEPLRAAGARVSTDFFRVFHVPALLGRYFLPDETADSKVVVLTHGLWQTRFAADSSIVGRSIALNGQAHTVIGVAPARFATTPLGPQLFTILTLTPQQRTNFGSHTMQAYAKLKTGVTIQQAQSDLDRIADGIRTSHPEQMRDRGAAVLSYSDWAVGEYDTQLLVLLGAVTVVLLIGCVNVASLLLARAAARRKEIAIRGALGGGRGRLVRQLLTESLVVSLAGGALGLLIAINGIRFLVGAGPAGIPRLGEATLSGTVLLFATLATIACGVLFGLAPALRATRFDLQRVLRDGGRGSRGAVRDRLRAGLIVGEIAVTLVLLIGASLFLRSAWRLQQVDLGFEPNGVTMLRVSLPADRYDSAEVITGAFSRIVSGMRALPGMESAGAGTRVPMLGTSFEFGIRVDGREGPEVVGHLRMITTGYLEAVGIPLRSGRLFNESDLTAGAAPVVLVNERFARAVFGDTSPLGRRISGWTSGDEPEWREIVGVIGDVRASGQDRDVPPEVYTPHTQARQSWWNSHQRTMAIVVRAPEGVAMAPAMRGVLRHFDPLLPVFDVQPLGRVLENNTAGRRFNTMLLSLLGGTGLLLAAIGIYGVIAFFVSQRTHEIGVRMALGASTGRIVGVVLREALVLSVIGIAVGALASFWATRVLANMLYDVRPNDPIAFGIGAGVLLLVALGASLLPARRAATVDPVKALGSA
jgi:putative ABC transport system permease protein